MTVAAVEMMVVLTATGVLAGVMGATTMAVVLTVGALTMAETSLN